MSVTPLMGASNWRIHPRIAHEMATETMAVLLQEKARKSLPKNASAED